MEEHILYLLSKKKKKKLSEEEHVENMIIQCHCILLLNWELTEHILLFFISNVFQKGEKQ